jgi:hypothetical protein
MPARVTASDVNLELQKHEVQCSERWSQNWNRMKKIESSIENLETKLDTQFERLDKKITYMIVTGFFLILGTLVAAVFA